MLSLHPTNACVYMKEAKHVYCVFLFKEQGFGVWELRSERVGIKFFSIHCKIVAG